MQEKVGGSPQGEMPNLSPQQPVKTQPKDYQDEAESRDSKFKATWDGQMADLKNTKAVSYRQASVLLMSWHESVDDLHVDAEVTSLEELFQQKFHYKTVRKTLTEDPRRRAQHQVNRYLADFVDDHDDTNTLLIIYYAGHGRPGEARGSLKLTGSTSPRPTEDSELHEIVWSSAEHNIKDTRGDVLVIFDCCHAGELERNVRANFNRRAFEFLAATSANSTTKKPGPHSFTSALIWSLNHLLKDQEQFSTQELLRTILNEAPNFPGEQSPRLSERKPASLRKIMLAPLSTEDASNGIEQADVDDDEELSEETRQDLLVRFVFNRDITDKMVADLAKELARLIRERDVPAKAALWEGINLQQREIPSQQIIAQYHAQKFLGAIGRKRNQSLELSPTDEVSGPANLKATIIQGFPQIVLNGPSKEKSLVAPLERRRLNDDARAAKDAIVVSSGRSHALVACSLLFGLSIIAFLSNFRTEIVVIGWRDPFPLPGRLFGGHSPPGPEKA